MQITTAPLKEIRHHLHRIAEPSGSETQTAELIESALQATSPSDLLTGIGGTGILAGYGSAEPERHILLRADMDALPIPESIEVEYASETQGTAHKCGHDGHSTMLIGAAREIGKRTVEPNRVSLVFQPAEETGEGAAWMLDDEAMKAFQPDRVYGIHNLPGFPLGSVIVRNGPFASASTGMSVRFKGRTSHAAEPERGRTPSLAVSHLIQLFSAMPQLHTALHEAAKVTVIHARIGEIAFGTTPGDAVVMATLRAQDQDVLDRLSAICEMRAQAVAGMFGLEATIDWVEPFPGTENDPEAVEIIRQAANDLDLTIIEKEHPFPWSEDFGQFTQRFGGALFGLGSGENHPALHNQTYDFPDPLLDVGPRLWIRILEREGVLQ
ncbi:amidohydrolase [bacterium]|nr:amidohydrolase [bacterium]